MKLLANLKNLATPPPKKNILKISCPPPLENDRNFQIPHLTTAISLTFKETLMAVSIVS